MKLIDEKGRLFKIINIIDLAVLIVLILAVGAVGYKFAGGKVNKIAPQTKELYFTVRCKGVYQSFADALKPGDKVISLTNVVADTYIDSVKSSPAETYVSTADGRLLPVKHPVTKDVYVTIRTKVNPDSTIFRLGPQDIAVGNKYTVKTQDAQNDGTIDSMQLK